MNVGETYEKFLRDYGDENVAALLTLAASILQPNKIDESAADLIQRGIRQGFFGANLGNQQNFIDSIIRKDHSKGGGGYESDRK